MGDPPQNLDMDKPCEICGDIGYADAIAVCRQCKITREHAYCMREVCDSDVEDWICEECESANHRVPGKQTSDTGTRFTIRKPPRNTKVQYIPPEEAMVLETGAMKKNTFSPSKSNLLRRPTVNKAPVPKRDDRCTTVPQVAPPGFRKPLSGRSMPISSQDRRLSTSKDAGPARQICREPRTAETLPNGELPGPISERDYMISRRTSSQLHQGMPAVCSDKGPAQQLCRETQNSTLLSFAKHPKPNAEGERLNSGHASVQSVHLLPSVNSEIVVRTDGQLKNSDSDDTEPLLLEVDRYLPNCPAVPPTWKGKFNIASDVSSHQSFDGIQAHPPCKVHSKVYNMSKQLPEALQFELLPRLNFWVDIFEEDVPGALDIGLYFLSSKRHETTYASLLEYLDEHDMLLRSCIDGVELLILSSKHLHEESQRLKQKNFLWGLFRAAEDNAAQEAQRPLLKESEDEDMEIDMEGGCDVGTVDVVVHQPSGDACPDTKDGSITLSERGGIIEASPKHVAAPILELTPLKVKKESLEDKEASLPWGTSCLQDELEFERELQSSFDRFAMLMQLPDADRLKARVKEEPRSPRSS